MTSNANSVDVIPRRHTLRRRAQNNKPPQRNDGQLTTKESKELSINEL